jgi:hypothetical protein
MRIFVADNNNNVRAVCKEYNIGILSSPSYFRLPPKDMDYILDNGRLLHGKTRICGTRICFTRLLIA